MGLLGTIGKAAYKVGKFTVGGILKGTSKVVVGTAKGGASIGKGIWAARNNTKGFNPIGDALHTGEVFTKGMGDWERAKDVFDPITGKVKHTDAHFKLGGIGKAAIFGPAAIAGTLGAADTYMDDRVGAIDGNTVTATPVIGASSSSSAPSYANNGGATGDLVFAMHNNRFG